MARAEKQKIIFCN